MAIHDKDKIDVNNATAGAAPVEEKQHKSGITLGFGLSNPSGIMPSSMGSEYTEQWFQALTKSYKSIDGFNVTLIKMDRNNVKNIAYSCILVCLSKKGVPNKVAFTTLLLAATGELPPKLENINTQAMLNPVPGKPPELIRVPSDAFDDELNKRIKEHIFNTFNNLKNPEFYQVDGVVVPQELDPNKEGEVWAIASTVGNADYWELFINSDEFNELVISEAMQNQKGTELTIDVRCDRGTIMNEVHQPKRHGFIVELNAKNTRRDLRSVNLTDTQETKIRCVGYTDFIPVAQSVGGMNQMATQVIRFRPHIILNSITSVTATPGFLMLGIAVGMSIRNNDLWLNTVKPSEADELHDPGALNYMANLQNNQSGVGKKVDFFAKGLSPYDVDNALRAMILPGAVLSVDVDVYGPQTWFTSILSSAAVPGPNQAGARRAIVAALDSATEGRFSTRFKSDNIFQNVVQVPMGTWVDNNSNVRDLAEFDFLAISNILGPENNQIASDWALTTARPNMNDIQAIVKRLDILKMVAPGANITGWSIRVTFTAEFLQALESSISESGFGANFNAPTIVHGLGNLTTVGDYMSGAAMPTGMSPLARPVQNNMHGLNQYWNVPGHVRSW